MRHLLLVCLLMLAAGVAMAAIPGPKSGHLVPDDYSHWNTMEVTASAYCSFENQTNSEPFIGAWGDRLRPGMKVVAVSRDLLEMGFDRNTIVRIQGLDGEYRVLDKMNKRWSKKIDIYYGLDQRGALDWGHQTVRIWWRQAS